MKQVVKGEKITIRSLCVDDAPLLVNWWNDGKIMKHVGYVLGLNITEDEVKKSIQSEVDDENEFRTSRRFLVYITETNTPIGEVSYQMLDMKNKSCTFGIKICDLNYQGQGYGKDTLITFITYLFKKFDLHRIELDTLLENVRAQALYEKVGFKIIGMRRDCWLDPLNNYRSAVLMDVIREEWFNFHKI